MFSETDLKMYAAFKSVVNQSDLQLKGNAAIAVGDSFRWFADLGKRIELNLEKQKEPAGEIKEAKKK
jgi:hypothetical protein